MIEYSAELHKSCFTFLEKAETETLLRVMSRVSYKAGDQVFQKGDPADCLYFLQAGRVAVQSKTGFGDRTQVVALLDPGAPVGEKGLLGGRNRGATVVAVIDSDFFLLSREAFAMLVEEEPGLAIKLLKWLLDRVSLRLEKNSERLVHVL
jgi:CRP-like cAMP-binding protein